MSLTVATPSLIVADSVAVNQGVNVLLAGQVNKRLLILGYSLDCTSGNLELQDTDGTSLGYTNARAGQNLHSLGNLTPLGTGLGLQVVAVGAGTVIGFIYHTFL